MEDRERRDDDSGRLKLSAVQVAAGALAAISSAVAASYLSVGGTIIGAAVGSVITTTAGAIYAHYLERSKSRLRHVVVTQVPGLTGVRRPDSVGTGGDEPGDQPGDEPGEERGEGTGIGGGAAWQERSRRWAPAAGLAVLVFMIAMAGVTAFESATGRTLNDTVHGEAGSGAKTSIGKLTKTSSTEEQDPSGDESPTGSPTTTPAPGSGGESPSQPTPDESTEPTPGDTGSGQPQPGGTEPGQDQPGAVQPQQGQTPGQLNATTAPPTPGP